MKFGALDAEMAEVCRYLQNEKNENQGTFNKPAFDIKNKVTNIESNFGRLDQGHWVELITKEVVKHAGAFSLLANQASAAQQQVQVIKGEMQEVKVVVESAVARMEAWDNLPWISGPPGFEAQPIHTPPLGYLLVSRGNR